MKQLMRKSLASVVHWTEKPHWGSSNKMLSHFKTIARKLLNHNLIQCSEQVELFL